MARIALSQRPSLRVIYITRFDVPEAERQDAAGPILSAPLDAEDIVREVERLLAPSLG